MEIRNCPNCGNIFAYTLRNLCPDCIRQDEQDFDKVREFIYDNPNATLEQVAEATEVTAKKVLQYLKEGRLMLKSNESIALHCEVCSEPILSGKFCEKCSRELKRGFQSNRPHKPFGTGSEKARVHLSKLTRDERK